MAGRFYPADPIACNEAAEGLVRGADLTGVEIGPWLGGVVPHAGWVYSGAIAAQTLAAIAAGRAAPPDVVVIFGAIHTPWRIDFAALDVHAAWRLPGGDCPLAAELTRVLADSPGYRLDGRPHEGEHAVEVELPLVRAVWPKATLLPVELPPVESAGQFGIVAAAAVRSLGKSAVFLASSDLTHYGPAYGFAPAGVGPDGLKWAIDNDRRLLNRVLDLDAAGVVGEARRHYNACGPGAIAAMLAACQAMGASRARLIRHTTSHQVAQPEAEPVNLVGYASAVVG